MTDDEEPCANWASDSILIAMKTNTLTQRLVRNLEVIRASRQWTADELAQRTGISRQLLSLWRTGKHSATLPSVEKVADALGVDSSDLLAPNLGEPRRDG